MSDLQADPNNPLFSIKSFEDLGLSQEILQGLYAMKFTKPSKIQERALPLLMHNPPTNMIGQSQSGTGKTAAFTLNILNRLELDTEENRKAPQALILAPSRELARQIGGVVTEMGRFVEGVSVGMAVKTEGARPSRLEHNVVCGTPGTVMDLIKRRILVPNKLKVIVLDEADNMLDQQGLGDQCIRVKAYITLRNRTCCKVLTFSLADFFPKPSKLCFSLPLSMTAFVSMRRNSRPTRTRSL